MASSHETIFDRNYGVKPIELASGDIVMRISVPEWADFVMTMIHQPGHPPGSYATGPFMLTPELITSTDIPPNTIHANRDRVAQRVTTARELSAMRPNSHLLLNTVIFDDSHPKPRIGTLHMYDGAIKGRAFKISANNPQERETFAQIMSPDDTVTRAVKRARAAGDIVPPFWGVQPLTCADFIDHSDILHPKTTAALISSCWSMPADPETHPPEARQLMFLEDLCTQAFTEHPNLQDIVMADRLPPNSKAVGPYNLHAYRS